jgi:hypothetical protein
MMSFCFHLTNLDHQYLEKNTQFGSQSWIHPLPITPSAFDNSLFSYAPPKTKAQMIASQRKIITGNTKQTTIATSVQ